jgi:hypothetical protein
VNLDHLRFGGGATETQLHPAVLVAMILVILAMFVLPRKYLVVPFLLCAFLIPAGQGVYFAGLHIFVLRIVLVFAWMRLAYEKFTSGAKLISGGFTSIDTALTLWAFCHSIAFVLLYREMGAVTNQVSFLWDVFAAYFLLRFLIQDEEDIRRVIKLFAVVAVIVAAGMVNEKLRNQNVFGFLGGIPIVPSFREGAIRAQGPFAISILAGAFGATLLPLFFWLWKDGKSRFLALAGMAGATIITATSASSTPLMAFLAGILAVCLWPVRGWMRPIRWGLVISLVVLNMIMKAPVWFLINHIDLVAGNSGYHRAMLIDQLVRHFSDWWLVGTASSPTWGEDMWDTSNTFVQEAILGGLLALIFFIAIISRGFARLGSARKAVEDDPRKQWPLWFLGAALFAHVIAYFGITYFDHMQIAWFTLLAIIAVSTSAILGEKLPAGQQNDEVLRNPRIAPVSLSTSQQTRSDLPYRNAQPFKPRSSYSGKLDK